MILSNLQNKIKDRVKTAAQELFELDLEQVNAEVPPGPELGDLAFPVSFELAKLIKQKSGEKLAPRLIAERLKEALESTYGIARITVAGAGYLNVFFDRGELLRDFAVESSESDLAIKPSAANSEKQMVEHTSINPNKAAHIGHVRNAVLGDTFVRILRAAGKRVEVQNYIDNTGVQVADLVVGFIHIEKRSLADIRALDRALPPDQPFDYYCWDLYTKVGLFYRGGDPDEEPNQERLKLRTEVLQALEEGNNSVAELADFVATRNVECILDTMERLNIRYDLLARESEILHLHFWDQAFKLMKESGVIRFETTGRNKGCWVMPFESHTGTHEHDADKIIVRSNGTVTYTGKDIAYQLWKLGHLGLDFYYREFRRYSDGHITWVTTGNEPGFFVEGSAGKATDVPPVIHSEELEQSSPTQFFEVPPKFGSGAKVYNVIDSRQSYPQEIVARGVEALVPHSGETSSVHLDYEMVALSPAAAAELGIQLAEEDRTKTFIEMSGRKGLGVKADDLINRLEADALREVEARHELTSEESATTAHEIAVGALRYFLLKFTRSSVIAFDFEEALSFEGETGPYCQYAAVRANSIFRKLEERGLHTAASVLIQKSESDNRIREELNKVLEGDEGTDVWALIMQAQRLDEVVIKSAQSAEPANLAKYVFGLAKSFNLFYHRYRIISEENEFKRAVLIVAADIVRQRLTAALGILGITVPKRM